MFGNVAISMNNKQNQRKNIFSTLSDDNFSSSAKSFTSNDDSDEEQNGKKSRESPYDRNNLKGENPILRRSQLYHTGKAVIYDKKKSYLESDSMDDDDDLDSSRTIKN